MSDLSDLDIDRLKLRQIIADIDQRLADAARRRQEVRLAPWALVMGGAAAGTGLFAAGATLFKLLQ